jgi:hypothetical protein
MLGARNQGEQGVGVVVIAKMRHGQRRLWQNRGEDLVEGSATNITRYHHLSGDVGLPYRLGQRPEGLDWHRSGERAVEVHPGTGLR